MTQFDLESVSFGQFCLFPKARMLYRRGVPVALGSRALDILIALVERAGEVVSQRELISRAWRGLVVDSANLRVQMTQLRRCLGDGEPGARYIANLPSQGYTFVAPISRPVKNDLAWNSPESCAVNHRLVEETGLVATVAE
jgi:DNA-binding winged helix-turn-helix (wHTH) protein